MKRGERRKGKVRKAIEHNRQLRKDQQQGQRLEEAEAPLPEYRQHVSPRKWRMEQDCKLAERETEVRSREERVLDAEGAVAEREKHADRMDREAHEVLAVAQAVADGNLTGLDQDQRGEGEEAPVTDRPTLARRLFGRAIDHLRTEQRAEARDEIAGAFDQIRRADDAIVRIANLLPIRLRQQVASARKSLSHAIMMLSGQGGGAREQDELRD